MAETQCSKGFAENIYDFLVFHGDIGKMLWKSCGFCNFPLWRGK
jgi:hypothetical protein